MDWASALGGLADKYLDFRRVESQDALAAQDAMFKSDMLRAAQQSGQSTQPGWIMPALLVGGGLLVVMMLVRK